MIRRVAILISGGGSNMVRLVESMAGNHPARPVLVLSSDPGASGLQKAAAMGVPAVAVDHGNFGRNREAFEAAMLPHIEAARPDLLCLAGFMRILTPDFISRFQGRIINIHPSLLPKYKGLDTHKRALAAGDREHGCTVHRVTAELDDGPILGQARVPVRPGDTPDTLAARVLEREHQLYPAVLRRLAEGDETPLMLA